MAKTKAERIEAVNIEIIALMLKRAKLRRYKGSWTEEQAVTEEIDKLEAQIKSIHQETI